MAMSVPGMLVVSHMLVLFQRIGVLQVIRGASESWVDKSNFRTNWLLLKLGSDHPSRPRPRRPNKKKS